MELSVVIVNYNVKHFLDQCLKSVIKATRDIDNEIIVVDNNSVDGSVSMLLEKYQDIILIENRKNLGFSKANNQAIKIAKGNYILLLNPDTVLDENSLTTCLNFMNSTPDAGAVGLKMIDGKGDFLPESKRALPTPKISFYRIFGLSRLFPASINFNRYYLKHLDDDKIHSIDILSGAFMFIRKEALASAGNLDERFFMYGEDIDLSYRITLAGYRNYYLPGPPIIHYKGESTRKSGINYVIHFYRSMLLFVRKHYSGRKATILLSLINIAILIRATLAFIKRAANILALPLLDLVILIGGNLILVKIWEHIKFNSDYSYPELFINIIVLSFSLLTVLSILAWRGYNKGSGIDKIIKGVVSGAVLMIIIYSLFPEQIRHSRALIILFALYQLISIPIQRYLLSLSGIIKIKGLSRKLKKIIIVSSEKEYDSIIKLVEEDNKSIKFLGRISTGDSSELNCLGTIDQIYELNKIAQPDEIIFNSNDLSTSTIIRIIGNRKLPGAEIKIACTDSDFVIGSKSGKHSGEVYSFDISNKK